MSAVLTEAAHLTTCQRTHVQLRCNVSIPEMGTPGVTYAVYHLEAGPEFTQFDTQPSRGSSYLAQCLLPGLYVLPLDPADNDPLARRVHLVALNREDGLPMGKHSPLRWLEQTIPWCLRPHELLVNAEQQHRTRGVDCSEIFGLAKATAPLQRMIEELRFTAVPARGDRRKSLPTELFHFRGGRLGGACAAASELTT